MRGSLLGVSAARYQSHRAIADFPPGCSGADCGDFASDFHPDDLRRARRRRIEALPLEQVGAIDARSADANQDFVGLDRRLGHLADFQRVFIAGFLNDYCFHHRYIIVTGICFQPLPS